MVLNFAEQRSESIAGEAVRRRVADRAAGYAEELAGLVDAAYRVVAETGSIDPPVRAILAEAGLSTQAFYRHVGSKDELLLIMLDEGRRSLVAYLASQMAPCRSASTRLHAWVRGVLAQAGDAQAARRTRPFLAQLDRLAEQFPEEQRRSEDLLIEQVAGAAEVDHTTATAIYDVAFGALGRHLRRGSAPTKADVAGVTTAVQRLCVDGGGR